jgi:outer membrane protein TolC
VLTVATRVSQQRTLLLDAQNQRDGARAVLARLIGARVDADFEPEAVLAEGALPVPASAQIIDLAAQPGAHALIGRRSCFGAGCRRTD